MIAKTKKKLLTTIANSAIEFLDPANLIPYANNPNTHTKEHLEQIKNSMLQFGWTSPILIDESGMVLAGHGRRMVSLQLELRTVPCLRMSGLSDQEKRAYVIADNRIPKNALWDNDLLTEELRDLLNEEFDLSVLGFADTELDALLGHLTKEAEGPSDPTSTWEGDDELPAASESSPESSPEAYKATYSILIDCAGEEDQVELLNEFQERGIKCRAFL